MVRVREQNPKRGDARQKKGKTNLRGTGTRKGRWNMPRPGKKDILITLSQGNKMENARSAEWRGVRAADG